MSKQRKATIYDVARAAKTSTATVSRVFGDPDYPVSQALRMRVLGAARDLGYVHQRRAASQQISVEVGVIVPNLTNPYFWQVVMGIEHEAAQNGGSIYMCNSSGNPQTELKYIRSLVKKGVHGVLLASVSSDPREIAEMHKKGLKLVMLDQSAGDMDCSKVGFNYVKGGSMAVQYLIGMGHGDIALVSAPLIRESRLQTLSGYKLGLMEGGIPLRENRILIVDSQENAGDSYYEYEVGRKSADALMALSPRPTAAFCLNDMIALGLISALKDRGLRVPHDMSVVGFDNIQASGMSRPELTTIAQPSYETGRMAYKILMDDLMNASTGNVLMTLEPELVVRHSVRRLGSH